VLSGFVFCNNGHASKSNKIQADEKVTMVQELLKEKREQSSCALSFADGIRDRFIKGHRAASFIRVLKGSIAQPGNNSRTIMVHVSLLKGLT